MCIIIYDWNNFFRFSFSVIFFASFSNECKYFMLIFFFYTMLFVCFVQIYNVYKYMLHVYMKSSKKKSKIDIRLLLLLLFYLNKHICIRVISEN